MILHDVIAWFVVEVRRSDGGQKQVGGVRASPSMQHVQTEGPQGEGRGAEGFGHISNITTIV